VTRNERVEKTERNRPQGKESPEETIGREKKKRKKRRGGGSECSASSLRNNNLIAGRTPIDRRDTSKGKGAQSRTRKEAGEHTASQRSQKRNGSFMNKHGGTGKEKRLNSNTTDKRRAKSFPDSFYTKKDAKKGRGRIIFCSRNHGGSQAKGEEERNDAERTAGGGRRRAAYQNRRSTGSHEARTRARKLQKKRREQKRKKKRKQQTGGAERPDDSRIR